MTDGAESFYRIGDVAEQVGITARTIRYYEELGLLDGGEARLKGSHRLYDGGDIARLRELVRLRELLGLSLEELTALADDAAVQQGLRNQWAASTDDAERVRIIETAIPIRQRQLDLVHARQRNLAEFEAELTDKLASMRKQLIDLTAP